MTEARERILDAMLDLATSDSYEATGVEEIVARAGVSREEFDRFFPSKEMCAIGVFERSLKSFNRKVQEAYDREPNWPDSMRTASYAAARWMSEHPQEMRFGAVELLWAGELAQARREEAFQRFVGMIDAGRELADNPDAIPLSTPERVMGSLAELITKRLQEGEVDFYAPVPELMYLAVRPYLGEEIAARELSIPPPRREADGG